MAEHQLEVEAWQLLRELAHFPDGQRRAHALADEAGLSLALLKALVRLPADRPMPMREIAAVLRCDTSYVTSVADGLEQHGLASRAPHKTDRRVKVVELTAKGAKLAKRARDVMDEPPPSLSSLDDDELSALVVLLRKLRAVRSTG